MKTYEFSMVVEVFDEELLLKAANEHLAGQGIEDEITDADDAIRTLLDPGGGGDAYAGNLNEVGIQIADSSIEFWGAV